MATTTPLTSRLEALCVALEVTTDPRNTSRLIAATSSSTVCQHVSVVPHRIAFRDERTLHTELQRGSLDAVVLLCRLHLARLTVASADYFGHVIEVVRFLSVICLRLALVPTQCGEMHNTTCPCHTNSLKRTYHTETRECRLRRRRPQPSQCMGHPPSRLCPRCPDSRRHYESISGNFSTWNLGARRPRPRLRARPRPRPQPIRRW